MTWNLAVVAGPEGEILEVGQAQAMLHALERLNKEVSGMTEA
jgi:hypothetical protein